MARSKPTLRDAVLYMGTGCKRGNMEKIKRTIKQFSPTTRVEIHCWTNDPDLWDVIVDYASPSRYNVKTIPGNWSLAVGHSAGGFPLRTTKARKIVGINPAAIHYRDSNKDWHIFRANKDWLVPAKTQALWGLGSWSRITIYKGGHSTMPIQQFAEYLKKNFKPRSSSSALDFKIPTGKKGVK